MGMLYNIMMVLLILVGTYSLIGIRYEFGPYVWIKRSIGHRRAQIGADRQELVARVQKLLPWADDKNIVFSLYKDTTTSSGSKVGVTAHTYYSRVFVLEENHIWIIPMTYDRKKRTYELGVPVLLPEKIVKKVVLSGRRKRTLVFTFWLESNEHLTPLEMVLAPFCFRLNSFYPFDMMQEAACIKAREVAEQLAFRAYGVSPEDLEKGRLKAECSQYGICAAVLGVIALLLIPMNCIGVVAFFLTMAVIMLGLILIKRQIPKVSALIVIIEIVEAYLIMR